MQSHHAIVLRNRVTKSRDAVSWGFMISYTYDCTKSEHKEIQDALKEALEMGIAPAYGTQSFGETYMLGSASPDVDPTVRTQAGQMLRNDREASLLRLPKSIGVMGIPYHISAPTSRLAVNHKRVERISARRGFLRTGGYAPEM
jgi:hypothetical protein